VHKLMSGSVFQFFEILVLRVFLGEKFPKISSPGACHKLNQARLGWILVEKR
jgi:hypothetical protein